ncbi:hypothetical protein D3C78_1967180 [compost metagenome]
MAEFCHAPTFCGPNINKLDKPRPMPIPAVTGLARDTATKYRNGSSSSASISKSPTVGISRN